MCSMVARFLAAIACSATIVGANAGVEARAVASTISGLGSLVDEQSSSLPRHFVSAWSFGETLGFDRFGDLRTYASVEISSSAWSDYGVQKLSTGGAWAQAVHVEDTGNTVRSDASGTGSVLTRWDDLWSVQGSPTETYSVTMFGHLDLSISAGGRIDLIDIKDALAVDFTVSLDGTTYRLTEEDLIFDDLPIDVGPYYISIPWSVSFTTSPDTPFNVSSFYEVTVIGANLFGCRSATTETCSAGIGYSSLNSAVVDLVTVSDGGRLTAQSGTLVKVADGYVFAATIPEPATWPMFVLGIGLVAAIRRRVATSRVAVAASADLVRSCA